MMSICLAGLGYHLILGYSCARWDDRFIVGRPLTKVMKLLANVGPISSFGRDIPVLQPFVLRYPQIPQDKTKSSVWKKSTRPPV